MSYRLPPLSFDDPSPVTPVAPDVEQSRLQEAFRAWNNRYTFTPGDIVQFKPCLRISSQTRGQPPTGAYLILLIAPNAAPHYDPHEMESYGICYDIRVGFYDEDGDFCAYWTDSRYYEPWTALAAKAN